MAQLREEAIRWFEEAEYDIGAAKDNLDKARYNWACFIAQQAAEKAIKSIYILRGESAERVHSIAVLIKGDAKRQITGIPEMAVDLESAMELDRHYIPTRYPNGVPFGKPYEFYSEEKAKECIECAERLISNCRKILEIM